MGSGLTVTKRVTEAPSGSTTARVTRSTVSNSIYDAWGGSWGDTWGLSWLVSVGLTSLGHTARVSGAITENTTKRVTGV